ncbi:uncharacterized protein LOC133907376 [Phragmites australis]|uniref:uncharacterized protein LOC133907376 n=1 Tax=Phragmites australis TaxID=29695 RepID=UPI002D7715D5|nr:uncharacterized protein LOC133907376 [Phragmites australis]
MSESTSSQPPGDPAAYNEAYLGASGGGVRFAPLDQELIAGYLQRKLRDVPLPTANVEMSDQDVYAEHPKNLVRELDKSFEGRRYLFSPRCRMQVPRWDAAEAEHGRQSGALEVGGRQAWCRVTGRAAASDSGSGGYCYRVTSRNTSAG